MKRLKIGVLGYNEGNGHPFSYSAIINGYDAVEMEKANWSVIYNYLQAKDSADLNFSDAEVLAVWTPYPEISNNLSKACYIPSIVDQPENMIGLVDAVIIARDDYECHFDLAKGPEFCC